MNKKFAAVLNCMDGRTQIPIINWIRENFDIDYVDLITEPGMDKVLSSGDEAIINSIKKKVSVSISAHDSKILFISGHHDCAGNPVDRCVHIIDIKKSVEIVKGWNTGLEVIGLWVNKDFNVERI